MFKKIIFLISLFILLGSVGCSINLAKISKATITSKITQDKKAADLTAVFTTETDSIYLIVSLVDVFLKTSVTTRWLDPSQKEIQSDSEVIKKDGDLVFKLKGPLALAGMYEVKIYINNELSYVIPFTIDQIALAKEISYLPKLELARGVNEETARPKDITNIFNPISPSIYLTLSTKALPKNSKILVRWYFVTDQLFLGEKTLALSGSNNVFFTLSQPEDGFSIGSYQARIYLNNKLIKSLAFYVR